MIEIVRTIILYVFGVLAAGLAVYVLVRMGVRGILDGLGKRRDDNGD